jgi:DNA-binding response OmpR family regulator
MVDPSSAPELVVGDLTVETAENRARRGARRLHLSPREHAVLVLLAEHAGETVSREHILRAVWHLDEEPTSNLVDTVISQLRAKVDKAHRAHLIHTVRGLGYMLAEAAPPES